MKTKDFAKIGKLLLPQMPGFVMEKKLIFKVPVGDFLQGMYFESSADADRFYFSVFFLPLFVPTEAVHGTFSKRIGRAINWKADNPNLLADIKAAIQGEALPFLNNVSGLAGVLNFLKERILAMRPRWNSHILEALAYTLIKSGEYPSALASLTELKGKLEGATIEWVVAQFDRVRLMESKLLNSSEAAVDQLEAWKAESVGKLKLEKYSGK